MLLNINGASVTGEQIRAARALLGWKAVDLSRESGISMPTVQRMDATRGRVSGRHDTVEAIREALEGAGIQFLASGEVANGPGVALKAMETDD